ncbi:MAG: hypothetical protein DRP42_00890 [Tenericutes bacterium]|nr:MAG: hypothetical protein DRP42_00890 [Mycoplasmatota bacterium]
MIFVLIAYLIGSLNFGQLLSRVKEVKLGEANSGNFGATNAGRTYGFKYFILVFIGDFSKVFVATAILLLFSTNILFFSHAALAFSLVFIIVGHM